MFGAIPVKSNHIHEVNAFDWKSRTSDELLHQVRMGMRILDTCMPKKLKPLSPRIIHEEYRDPVVRREITRTQQLPVALVICKRQRLRSDSMEEPRRPSPVLDVGPSGFAHGRKVERIPAGDEFEFLRAEDIIWAADPGIHRPPIVLYLRACDLGCGQKFKIMAGHKG